MEFKLLAILLVHVYVMSRTWKIDCRPRVTFSILQIKRNLNNIWKDYDDSNAVSTKKVKKKIKTRSDLAPSVFASDTFSNCRAVRLVPGESCRNLIVRNGVVMGSDKKLTGDDGIFQIESYGTSIVRLKYVKSGQYLAINDRGKVFLTKDKSNDENYFVNMIEEQTLLYTFASWKYYMDQDYHDLFIGIKRKKGGICKMINARRTKPDLKSNQFGWDERDIDQSKYCRKN